jgi:hypothetical protein
MATFTFWTTIDERDAEVTYTCTDFVPATRMQPAEGGEVELESITIDGTEIELPPEEEAKVLKQAEDRAQQDYEDHDPMADYADYLRDSRIDARLN